MIEVINISPPVCDLYDPEGVFMGEINEYEFYDIRSQIKKEQVEGYYCIFNLPHNNEYKFNIDKNGRSNDWCEGTFDLIEKSLMRIL